MSESVRTLIDSEVSESVSESFRNAPQRVFFVLNKILDTNSVTKASMEFLDAKRIHHLSNKDFIREEFNIDETVIQIITNISFEFLSIFSLTEQIIAKYMLTGHCTHI